MTRGYVRSLLLILALMLSASIVWADGSINLRQSDGTKTQLGGVGDAAKVSVSALAGQDVTNDVLKVEQRFTHSAVVTADTAVKASPGFVHNLVCIGTDVAATAGTIILYDNTSESGTVVVSWDVQVLNYQNPLIFPLDVTMTTGIFLGFTTVTDVKCYVSYR